MTDTDDPGRPSRYDQCDDTCTVDCGHCKGQGPPKSETPYVAGWNIPGYLPESDPVDFDTFNEAVDYLAGEVQRFWDEDYEAAPDCHPGCHQGSHDQHCEAYEARNDADGRWLPVHTALHGAGYTYDDGTHAFAETCGDGYLEFWISPGVAP